MAEDVGYSVRIVDVTKLPSAEQGRIGKYDVVVTYQDPAGRMRVISIPWEKLEGLPEDEMLNVIAEYIKRNERWRKVIIGKEVTV